MKRAELLESLPRHGVYDLAVVGGGATGLGVALDAALRGHLQGIEGNRILGGGGFLSGCYQRQQGGKSGNEGARDRKAATGSTGRGHGGRLCLEGW